MEDEAVCNERRIFTWHRSNDVSGRLATIPVIGPIIPTAFVSSVSDPSIFKPGFELVARIGIAPNQSSTGGRE